MVWGRGGAGDSATHRDGVEVDGEKEAVIEERERGREMKHHVLGQ